MSTFQKLLLERMARAFIAAAAGTLAVGISNADLTVQGLKAVAIGAVASGISACISLVSQFFGDPESTSLTKVTVSK
jgi:hypothetical protein